MAFTMHSHSGEFCPGHAVDQLEAIIQHAISIGFKTMGLSEHMPRYEERDLYPEELDDPQASLAVLPPRHDAYLVEAQRLQAKYAAQISILIGFEAEFIRPSYAPAVLRLATDPRVDYFIGSLHHVHGHPIDYGPAAYAAARAASSDPARGEESLWEDYYDQQRDMLLALRPRVVGHFDLVRLLAEDPARDVRAWKGVWERVVRNLKIVREQGGWLECNTAALRKGLAEPYPCRAIAEEWLKMGGKFTMSDDSHGIAHVATNYARGAAYLESLGVEHVWTFRRRPQPALGGDAGGKGTGTHTLDETAVPLREFTQLFK
ncbi:histidinol-phosphatase [Purpureocillium lilacinum]|uniref:Histidinol-phosphatase n=1 Tax=Purpureocillium lilacinum TaxID=33203 RepID=A0A179HAQ2_PURLI|nr:histidinol-phosphatase [Purpureocillium lilacinum]GJN66465.1 histidinolphosphatase [Purpureocillium lilacinum]